MRLPDLQQSETQPPGVPRPCEFNRRIAAVEKLKVAQRASLAELDALFVTLQHRAFRGELFPIHHHSNHEVAP